MKKGAMYLRRRVSFAAGHAYWLKNKTEDENQSLFGKWASPWGHGHNYTVEAVVVGETNPRDGMVVNITEVDHANLAGWAGSRLYIRLRPPTRLDHGPSHDGQQQHRDASGTPRGDNK